MSIKENKIKFSDDYEKLPMFWKDNKATLLSIVKVNDMDVMREVMPNFFYYDSKYRNKDGSYKFDFKVGIILIFIHLISGAPFTTIRRYTDDKYNYYESKVGQVFTLAETEVFGNG